MGGVLAAVDGDDGALEEDSDAVSDRGRLSSAVYLSSPMMALVTSGSFWVDYNNKHRKRTC